MIGMLAASSFHTGAGLGRLTQENSPQHLLHGCAEESVANQPLTVASRLKNHPIVPINLGVESFGISQQLGGNQFLASVVGLNP
jgi:hypothetical protein